MQKLNCHSITRHLNSLCKFLNDTYNINCGGCCFIAYLIAKHLDRLGIEYALVIYDYFKKDISSIEYEVLNRRMNKDYQSSVTGHHCCNHYCLHVKGAGIVNDGNYSGHRYTISDLSCKNIYWIYKNSKWNPCYDVQHNRIIKNIVKEFFKEYE